MSLPIVHPGAMPNEQVRVTFRVLRTTEKGLLIAPPFLGPDGDAPAKTWVPRSRVHYTGGDGSGFNWGPILMPVWMYERVREELCGTGVAS